MARRCWLALLPLVLLATVGASGEAPTEPRQDAVAATQSDLEAVRQVVNQYDEAISSGNVDGLMALYGDDAVDMPPNEPAVVGRSAIRSRVEKFLADHTDSLRDTVEDVQASGVLAFARLNYTESWTPKAGGDTTTVVGKSVFTFKRHADGSWKIATVIWNSDAPAK